MVFPFFLLLLLLIIPHPPFYNVRDVAYCLRNTHNFFYYDTRYNIKYIVYIVLQVSSFVPLDRLTCVVSNMSDMSQ